MKAIDLASMPETLSSLGIGQIVVPARLYPAVKVAHLSLGLFLQVLTPKDCIAIELARLEAGYALTPEEESIALSLSDEVRAVEELLDGLPLEHSDNTESVRFWVLLSFSALLDRWRTYDFPEYEARELDLAWGADTAFTPVLLRYSRGLFSRREKQLASLLEVARAEEASLLN